MKKLLAIALAVMILLSLAACGGNEGGSGGQSQTPTQEPTAGTDIGSDNPVSDVFHAAVSSATGAYATIEISPEVKMDDDSAWLGLCPAGTDYVTEAEADEVDVIYFSYDAREEGEPYVYACDFSSVEDGTYALVVTSSDDASIGYVVIQLLMTKDGEKLSFDYTDAKYNERPSDVQEDPSDDPGSTELPGGDPAEYSREYWEELFPGENVCPFFIEENGVERSYYWVSSIVGWDGRMGGWINQPFNWNGWHKTADGCIVNKDETLKITDNWANGDESMSSYCTVTTEKYDKDSAPAGSGEPTGEGTDPSGIAYKFAPPADGYRVEYTTYYEGEAYQNVAAKSGNVFLLESEGNDRKVKYDFNEGTAYVDDWSGSYGWTQDGEEFSYAEPYEDLTVYEFGYFEEYFMEYFRNYGFTEDKLAEYCIGTEVVADCGCWIFEDKTGSFVGYDGKFWVNMDNGICMKSTDSSGSVDYEITSLDLNY